MQFQRFTVDDYEQLLQEIAQLRDELADAEARGDPPAILELAATLGELLTTARQEEAAREVLEAHLPLAREHIPSEASGWLLLALATANQYLERRPESGAQFAEALRLAEACGSQRLAHYVLHHWGRALVEEGELERAMGCFTSALQIRIALNEPRQASTRRAIDALTALSRPATQEATRRPEE
jgi:tetratricopeptide (TPR) repeat protein